MYCVHLCVGFFKEEIIIKYYTSNYVNVIKWMTIERKANLAMFKGLVSEYWVIVLSGVTLKTTIQQ